MIHWTAPLSSLLNGTEFVFHKAVPRLWSTFDSSSKASDLLQRGYWENVPQMAALLALRGEPADAAVYRELWSAYAAAFQAQPSALSSNFFSGSAAATAAYHGHRRGWLSSADLSAAAGLLQAVCAPDWSLRGAQNQAFARAAGTALYVGLLSTALPLSGTDAAEFAAYVDAVWSDFAVTAHGDTTENAPQYNVIFLANLFLLADGNATRHHFLQQSAAAFRMMVNFALQVSPSGALPSYGDDGLGTPLVFAGDWAAVLARAVSLYEGQVTGTKTAQDVDAMRAAAQRVWRFNTGDPLTTAAPHRVGVYLHPIRSTQPLFHIAMLQAPSAALLSAASPAGLYAGLAGATVLTRYPQVPDKVLLLQAHHDSDVRSSAFVVGDVFLSPLAYHSHAQQIGALSMYSVGDAVLLYGLGYNNRLQNQSNTLVVTPPDPPSMSSVMAGQWQTARLPTSLLEPLSAAAAGGNGSAAVNPWRAFNRTVTFRVQYRGGGSGTLTVRNVQLQSAYSGGHGRVLPLPSAVDGFGAVDGGRQAQYHNCGGDRVTFNTYTLANGSVVFDCQQYPYLQFEWQFVVNASAGCGGDAGGTAPDNTNTLLIFRASPNAAYDVNVLTAPMPTPTLTEAVPLPATATSTGQYGARYRFTGYGTPDTNWTRELYLNADRSLLVRDTVVVGAQWVRDGYGPVGPIWNLLGNAYEQDGSTVTVRGFPNTASAVAHDDALQATVHVGGGDASVPVQVSNQSVLWANVQPVRIWAQQLPRHAGQVLLFETRIDCTRLD
ncbi:hypothetical protein CDCA_CDCA16G4292 [Cyanidium caldarium]|uniref:Uncharacterized protein n=1 Tax=Cyanidium caldarium TaxID=2771 RepID=A0AAV9J116_CYACA|nr:hypothetical protein CDCA_CDCA16G4292 [Cyanidium caldarium]